MSELDDKWAAHVRGQHPELSEAAIRRIADEAAKTLQDPSQPTPQPPDLSLPFWARAALAMGGRSMLGKMIGNKYTTSIAAALALFEALCHGGILPASVCVYEVPIVTLLAALGFTAAKDGSTGSAPGATS